MELIKEYVLYVIGAAAFLGFVFAWLVRGGMLAGKRRRATVERDIAITELEQVRTELDSLYAAQRKQKEASGGGSAQAAGEIRERDERIRRMSDELAEAKAALQSLKSGDAAPAPSVQPASSEELESAKSRNEFLEGRVRELEAKVSELGSAAQAQPVAEGAADQSESDKLEWQVNYLKTRIAALEDQALSAAPAASQTAAATEPSAADEELARLRWRNRYLEGRLAYFEERPDVAEVDGEPDAESGEEPRTGSVSLVPEPDADPVVSAGQEEAVSAAEEAEGTADAETISDEADQDATHPADRVLQALDAQDSDDGSADSDAGVDDEPEAEIETPSATEGVRPEALDRPNGQPDDLTLITGVGPRIQTILNDYGIWHFSQIAQWSDDNEAWIDRELNFAGRVSREGWINQARELAAADAAN
ncbi:MAG: hypothetical protein RLN72_04580 [Henriciella sp.]